jgi:hypothetical protein
MRLLGRALARLGLEKGDTVTVLCCAAHGSDSKVALGAAELLELSALDVAVEASDDVAHAVRGSKATVACEHGAAAWRRGGHSGLLIADGPDCHWWKMLELRERQREREQVGERHAVPLG